MLIFCYAFVVAQKVQLGLEANPFRGIRHRKNPGRITLQDLGYTSNIKVAKDSIPKSLFPKCHVLQHL